MGDLHRELAHGSSAPQDDDPLIFLGGFGAIFRQRQSHAGQEAEACGLDRRSQHQNKTSPWSRHLSDQQSRPNRSRLLHGQVGTLLQEDLFVDKEGVLKRGELVLAKGRAAVDMVAGSQFRTVGTNFENDTGTVAANDGGPLVDEKASVLLQGLTGSSFSETKLLSNEEGVAHTGLIPTARHFTRACFGPGVKRGRLLTTV